MAQTECFFFLMLVILTLPQPKARWLPCEWMVGMVPAGLEENFLYLPSRLSYVRNGEM